MRDHRPPYHQHCLPALPPLNTHRKGGAAVVYQEHDTHLSHTRTLLSSRRKDQRLLLARGKRDGASVFPDSLSHSWLDSSFWTFPIFEAPRLSFLRSFSRRLTCIPRVPHSIGHIYIYTLPPPCLFITEMRPYRFLFSASPPTPSRLSSERKEEQDPYTHGGLKNSSRSCRSGAFQPVRLPDFRSIRVLFSSFNLSFFATFASFFFILL